MTKSLNWSESFFDTFYKDLFMKRSEEEIFNAYSSLSQLCSSKKTVCDFCCGTGDILKEFQNKGWTISGIDVSKEYTEAAKKERGLPASQIITADAKTHCFDMEFDLVYSWHSCLGYSAEEDDKALIENMCKHVKKTGIVAIELYNLWEISKNFKEKINYQIHHNNILYTVTRECQIDITTQRMNQTWKYSSVRGEIVHKTSMRLYSPGEIIAMLENAGLRQLEILNPHKKGIVIADINSSRLLFKGVK